MYPAGSPIEVGDTAPLHASARYCDLVTCPHAISELEPHRFRWESANPAVADISERGFLRARSVGVALIRVTFLGSNGDRSAQFTTPVVSSAAVLSPRFDRDTARVGDTVSVTIRWTRQATQSRRRRSGIRSRAAPSLQLWSVHEANPAISSSA